VRAGSHRSIGLSTRTVLPALLAALVSITAAAQPSVSAQLDRAIVGVNEIFYLNVIAQGTRVSQPVLPEAPDLVFNPNTQAHRRSMQVQIVNGRVTQTATNEWTFEGSFSSAGSKEIPPVKVQIDGKDYLTPKLTIEVSAQSSTPIRPQPGARPQPGGEPQTDAADLKLEDLVYIECEVSKTEIYQGEPLLLTVRFGAYNAPGVAVRGGQQGNSITLPSVEGFYEGDIARDERIVNRGGHNFSETTFSRPLVATRPGDMVVPEVSWSGRVTAPTRFGPSSMNVEKFAPHIQLRVKPLPSAPPEFSGAVGRFTFKAELESGAVQQGVPKKLSIVVAGQGNADSIAKPVLPALDWCHVGEPETQVTLLGPLEFEKSFVYALTPSETEAQTIPSIEFCFFSPELGTFKTLKTQPIDVNVRPGDDSGGLVVVGGTRSEQVGALEVLGDDITPIASVHRGLNRPGSPLAADVLFTAAPPLAFAACAVLLRHRRRLQEDTGYARTRRARSRGMRRLRGVASSPDPAEALYKTLAGYLGDKLNLHDAGLTSNDVARVMSGEGFPEALRESYSKILRACERHRYAGDMLSADEVQALTEAAAKAMDDLDEVLVKRSR